MEYFNMITDQDLHLMYNKVLIYGIEKKINLCDGFCLYFKNPETVLKGVTSLCLGCKEKRILVAFRNLIAREFFDTWKKLVKKKRPASPSSVTEISNVFNNKKIKRRKKR